MGSASLTLLDAHLPFLDAQWSQRLPQGRRSYAGKWVMTT
jgi:hypothetical protein